MHLIVFKIFIVLIDFIFISISGKLNRSLTISKFPFSAAIYNAVLFITLIKTSSFKKRKFKM